MEVAILLALGSLFFALYSEHRVQQAQFKQLREVMDYQLDGLRHQFAEVKDLLKWTEPQMLLKDFGTYVAVRHTGLTSVKEVMDAVETGEYPSAIVPFTVLIKSAGTSVHD